jgi:DNA-binding SARP family transcriptional activator
VIQLLDTPPGVTGLSGELVEQDRTRVIEVLAYLALHDNSCTLTEISDALFPRAGVAAPRRIDDALAATRRALNEQIAISISPERITVGREMTSDWSDLTRALASARAGSASDTLVVLAEVVERSLRPLAAAFRWMHTEGHLVRLSFELCDAMHQLFSLALAQSDFDLADRALLVGLANEPTSELLIRDLMILQNERGGSGAVTACYEQLEAALVEVGGREPSWTTRALFEELAGRSG